MPLGLTQTVTAVKLPNSDSAITATSVSINNFDIESVTAVSTAQANSYPGAVARIYVKYYSNNAMFTGFYYVTQSVAAIITASGGYLITLNVLQTTNGNPTPLSQGAGNVYGISTLTIVNYAAATAKQITQYPNAATQIFKKYYMGSQQLTGTMIVTQTPTAILALT